MSTCAKTFVILFLMAAVAGAVLGGVLGPILSPNHHGKPNIDVTEAVYGLSCSSTGYSVLDVVESLCDGMVTCQFSEDNGRFGDPFPGYPAIMLL